MNYWLLLSQVVFVVLSFFAVIVAAVGLYVISQLGDEKDT
jgi:hypothetical protein